MIGASLWPIDCMRVSNAGSNRKILGYRAHILELSYAEYESELVVVNYTAAAAPGFVIILIYDSVKDRTIQNNYALTSNVTLKCLDFPLA
jgi:hypothetical protein